MGHDRSVRVGKTARLGSGGANPGPAGLGSAGLCAGADGWAVRKRTRQALREWQAGEGVTATGYLTREQADTLIAQGQEETPEASFQISPDQTCARRPEGAGCWMELANQAGCHVWNDNLKKDETMMWTGECSNGLAQGKGVLTSSHDEGERGHVHRTSSERQAARPLGRTQGGRRIRGAICGRQAAGPLGPALCGRGLYTKDRL